MYRKLVFALVLALIFGCVAIPARSQVVQPAKQGKLPLTVGFGFADYSLDWDHSRRGDGLSTWVDWRLHRLPPVLNGLGIQLEWRSIWFNIPSELKGHRMDTGLGGVYYQFRKYELIRPYAKYNLGFGSIDFPSNPPSPPSAYTHDTRNIYAPSAGADVRLWKGISARVDYEYQFWPEIFGPHSLNPNGFTIGASCDLGRQLR